jgi:mercuric ion transport protein
MSASRLGSPSRAAEVRDATLLRTGIVGSVIAALCCFTPVLVILLGAVGLSALIGWLDVVLLPALAVFLGIAAYALWRRHLTA